MQTITARIGKHIQDVAFFFSCVLRRPESGMLVPVCLPTGFYFGRVVSRHSYQTQVGETIRSRDSRWSDDDGNPGQYGRCEKKQLRGHQLPRKNRVKRSKQRDLNVLAERIELSEMH